MDEVTALFIYRDGCLRVKPFVRLETVIREPILLPLRFSQERSETVPDSYRSFRLMGPSGPYYVYEELP